MSAFGSARTKTGTRRGRQRPLWQRLLRSAGLPPSLARWLKRRMPRRLFPRSLLIIVLPIIILESVVTIVFMDRHWSAVTHRLSNATASDVAALATVLEGTTDSAALRAMVLATARVQLFDEVRLLPPGPLPPKIRSYSLFDLLHTELSTALRAHLSQPFWIDTVHDPRFVQIRVALPDATLQVITRRSQTYATNSHITLVWMAGVSVILIAIAVLFLRNQVRPIQQLAEAAERFGQGRPLDSYKPYGALEVRQAAWAFIEMRRRIERQIEQRTALLAGVSHDLRTLLTRLKLELALLGDMPEAEDMRRDVDAMQAMLEDYLVFARTEADEHADAVDLELLVGDVARYGRANGADVSVRYNGSPIVSIKPTAFRRMLSNIVVNATHYAKRVEIAVRTTEQWLTVLVDDDGPGIPEAERETAFKPFQRLDVARNQTVEGTGLGLTIARDIARRHGGDIRLAESPLGGLRAEIRIPA